MKQRTVDGGQSTVGGGPAYTRLRRGKPVRRGQLALLRAGGGRRLKLDRFKPVWMHFHQVGLIEKGLDSGP